MQKQTVAVVGLGYVGLPLALLAKEKGWNVCGYEISKQKVDLLRRRKSPLDDPALQKGVARYPLTVSTSPEIIKDAQIIIVTVPTPVTGRNLPDLRPLKNAITDILPYLTPKQVLIIESTINPGVMDEVVLPLLRRRRDLTLDVDGATNTLYVTHCPERINPGDTTWTIRSIPRVLGGYSKPGIEKAKAFYESILDGQVKVMSSVAEAEAVKILENSFRDVNIAFVNEMAKSFDKLGIDIVNVIEGAATKPFGFLAHYPGNGVGGHCISVDPYYMIERGRQAGFDHEFLKLARTINDSMPVYTVNVLRQGLKQLGLDPKQQSIAFLGVTYKKNVDDTRESPAITILELLKKTHFLVNVFDPHVPRLSTVESLPAALHGATVVMVGADHAEFVKALTPQRLVQAGIKLVVDGKNALDAEGIAAAGILYLGIGRSRHPH